MSKYLVLHDYKSHLAQYKTGDVVELDTALAEWLNRDSPGVIEPYTSQGKVEEVVKADRMVRKPGKQRAENMGEIDKSVFKAVRNKRDG